MSIYYSDLEILSHLIQGPNGTFSVHDPYDHLLVDQDSTEVSYHRPGIEANLLFVLSPANTNDISGAAFILDFTRSLGFITGYKQEAFHGIRNHDKSLRWFYPAKLKRPLYLSMYSAPDRRGKVIKELIRISHQTGIRSFLPKMDFDLFFQNTVPWFKDLLEDFDKHEYACFTGTLGPNRKSIFAIANEDRVTTFVKVPFNQQSKANLQNERVMLEYLRGKKFKHSYVPQVVAKSSAFLAIESVQFKHSKASINWNLPHSLAILEWAESAKKVTLGESGFYRELKNNLLSIQFMPDRPTSRTLMNLLEDQFADLDTYVAVPMSFAHMDFTPWNVYQGKTKLYPFDLELGRKQMPLLFDLFHFHFQKGTLIERKGFKEILEEIYAVCDAAEIRGIIELHQINVFEHIRLYLLYTASYYYTIFQEQSKKHIQIDWLTYLWIYGLNWTSKLSRFGSQKQFFQLEFFSMMHNENYALLKAKEARSQFSDLDLLVEKGAIDLIINWVESHETVKKAKVRFKNNMANIAVYFFNGEFLSLDLIHEINRKQWSLLDADSLIQQAWFEKGIKQVTEPNNFKFIGLFHYMNFSKVPAKYQRSWKESGIMLQEEVNSYFLSQFNLRFEELFYFHPQNRIKIISGLKRRPQNSWLKRVERSFRYLKEAIQPGNGLAISFSGVDGAGKSTILSEVKSEIEQKFRREVVVFRHRPSLLPIISSIKYGKKGAEQRSLNSLPRQGRNQNRISSLIRFAYYYLDYTLGHPLRVLIHLWKGNVVLYDRYYFDFIADPRRSNISINQSIVRFFYRFIFKPNLNFFITASADEILKRKQELSLNDIKKLNRSYSTLFRDLSAKRTESYQTIVNNDLDQSVNTIINEVIQNI